ncbi:MAG: FAD:protein FMN transferase [Kangiellaceae bacterium]|jgi:FAD:protein FMN transferase
MNQFEVSYHQNFSRIAFTAMASPCEILLRNLEPTFCHTIANTALNETSRIEKKYSRFIHGNLVDTMNKSQGKKITIDDETFKLLEYARNLFELSNGLFDISSGVLRKIWRFENNSSPPSQKQISHQLKKIGFDKIDYDESSFYMNKGMEIDFGGIGKEYAVDQVSLLLLEACTPTKSSFLVNFGGDLSARKLASDALPWTVGVESVGCQDELANEEWPNSFITISQGAVATSGNTKRFFDYEGKRYGHLMNPKTGYPVENPPLSVTTFADNCVMAGSYSSLAMLMGAQAEEFLTEQSIKHLCFW